MYNALEYLRKVFGNEPGIVWPCSAVSNDAEDFVMELLDKHMEHSCDCMIEDFTSRIEVI